MTFILHVGTHKTGTTSIQHFFRKNDKLLRERGIWYPNYNIINKAKRYAHHEVAHAIAGKSKNISFENVKSFITKINNSTALDEKILISAEPFYRHHVGSSTKRTLWADKETYIKRVSQLFGSDSEIIFVLRRQDYFAASLYQENIKVNRYAKSFTSFKNEYMHYFDYYRNIKLWNKHFDKIKVLIFEDLIANNSLEYDFCKALGVSDFDDFKTPSIKNESLHPYLIEFKRLVNGSPLSLSKLDEIKNNMLNSSPEKAAEFPVIEYCWHNSDSRDAFLDLFIESNKLIHDEYISLNRNSLFSETKVKNKTSFTKLSECQYIEYLKHYVTSG